MSASTDQLLERQNADGGWNYRSSGSSWTEPTCFALLALLAEGHSLEDTRVSQAVQWVKQLQNTDGGWPPRPGIPESTWVTALVLALPDDWLQQVDTARATEWLVSQTGQESGFWQRLRLQLLGIELMPGQEHDGWPWYTGAAAWVYPTALSLLTMQKLRQRQGAEPGLEQRIQSGLSYLLTRRCRDGGWNHGSTRALGYDSDSYPETTGVALTALHGADDPSVQVAIRLAEQFLASSKSLESSCWLTIALAAHGRSPQPPTGQGHGGTLEIALTELARHATEGRNVLIA